MSELYQQMKTHKKEASPTKAYCLSEAFENWHPRAHNNCPTPGMLVPRRIVPALEAQLSAWSSALLSRWQSAKSPHVHPHHGLLITPPTPWLSRGQGSRCLRKCRGYRKTNQSTIPLHTERRKFQKYFPNKSWLVNPDTLLYWGISSYDSSE